MEGMHFEWLVPLSKKGKMHAVSEGDILPVVRHSVFEVLTLATLSKLTISEQLQNPQLSSLNSDAVAHHSSPLGESLVIQLV